MIPTSIDGTDITGATIDGTDVTEITVDGQTVFTAVPSNPVADANLVHWIPFRGTPTDIKGNMGTLVTNGGNPTIQPSGGVNDPYTGGDGDNSGYLELDGNDSLATSSSGVFINDDNDLTTMVWVKPDSTGSSQTIVNGNGTRLAFGIDLSFAPASGLQAIKLDAGGFRAISGGTPDTTKWQHLCLTWDKSATQMEFYVDGTSQGTTSAGRSTDNVPFVFGSSVGGGARFYDGDIDDFRHYDTILNTSQINEIITNTDPN